MSYSLFLDCATDDVEIVHDARSSDYKIIYEFGDGYSASRSFYFSRSNLRIMSREIQLDI